MIGDTETLLEDNATLETVRRVRRDLAEDGPSALRAVGDFECVSVPSNDGDALRDLLLPDNTRVVVEIGLAYGASALAIAEALVSRRTHGAVHVIIDAFQDDFHDAGWTAITNAGLTDICSLLRERSQFALPRLVTEGLVADAAFVDGSHSFHNIFVDLFFLRDLVRPGGLVIVDDCSWPSVATAVRYFELNAGWQEHLVTADTRLRAFRLPDPRTELPFEQFKPFGLNSAP